MGLLDLLRDGFFSERARLRRTRSELPQSQERLRPDDPSGPHHFGRRAHRPDPDGHYGFGPDARSPGRL